METGYYTFQPQPHLHGGGKAYIPGGGADNYNNQTLTIDEAYILGLYDNNISFLSLLNTPTPPSFELPNFPPSLTSTYFHHPIKMEPYNFFSAGADSAQNIYKKIKRCTMKMKPRKDEVDRKRRQKISEKNIYLKKLLPSVTKMDTATMYEEAAKYIKFLEAQIHVLKSMKSSSSSFSSCSSSSSSSSPPSYRSFEMELLKKLDREELLAVMLNSPAVQTVLTREGWCVYTVEQMDGLFNNMAAAGNAPPADAMLGNYYYYY